MPFCSMPGSQTHGLVAHRSIGNENDRVDTVGAAARQQLRAIPVEGSSTAAVRRRAVEPRRDFAYPARRCAAPQFRQREIGVAVLGGGTRSMATWEIRRSWSIALSPE